jgi:tetratricopeptide (TPR) repeat protein
MRLGRVGRVVAVFAIFGLGSGSAFAAAAKADPNNVTAQVSGTALTQAEAKRKALLAKMMADPSNLDLAFEYAALSSQVGDLEGAISTLERMLIYAPGLPRLDLELGVLYYRLGANDSAKSYFEAALAAPDVPAEVKAKVEPYLASIAKNQKTDGFSGWITVGGRYQTNANGGPSSPLVTLNGLPFTLNAAGMGHPDTNGYVSGQFDFAHDLHSQGDRLLASLNTYGAIYANDGTLDTGVAELHAGPELNLQRIGLEDATIGLYAIATGVVLGGDPYLFSGGVGADFEKGIGQRAHLGVKTEYRYDWYQNSASRPLASDGSGQRLDASTTLQYQLNDVLSVFTVLNGERRATSVGYISNWDAGATLGITWMFDSPFRQASLPWSVTVSGSFDQRRFDAPDPLINATTAQVDNTGSINGSLTVPLDPSWAIQMTASYARVMSNYDLDSSENTAVTLGVTRKF